MAPLQPPAVPPPVDRQMGAERRADHGPAARGLQPWGADS